MNEESGRWITFAVIYVLFNGMIGYLFGKWRDVFILTGAFIALLIVGSFFFHFGPKLLISIMK